MSSILPVSLLSEDRLYVDEINKKQDSEQKTEGTSAFDNILNAAVDMYNEADTLQKAAEEAEISFALGYTDSIHDLAVAQQKANISLQYTVKVTNAVVSAYKELMNMQL